MAVVTCSSLYTGPTPTLPSHSGTPIAMQGSWSDIIEDESWICSNLFFKRWIPPKVFWALLVTNLSSPLHLTVVGQLSWHCCGEPPAWGTASVIGHVCSWSAFPRMVCSTIGQGQWGASSSVWTEHTDVIKKNICWFCTPWVFLLPSAHSVLLSLQGAPTAYSMWSTSALFKV